MFKWICLLVAIAFLAGLTWMINDARLQLRRTAEMVQTATKTINEKLPVLLDRSDQTLDTVNSKLPEIMTNVHTATEALADVAEDLGQLREFAGATSPARDKALFSYADSLVSTVEKSGGTIGLKKTTPGPGLRKTQSAGDWAASVRREAMLLSVLTNSKKELATRLTKSKLGSPWYIQLGENEAVQLLDWVKANHPDSKDL